MDVLDLPVHEALQQVQALLSSVQRVVAGVEDNNTQSDPGEDGIVPALTGIFQFAQIPKNGMVGNGLRRFGDQWFGVRA